MAWRGGEVAGGGSGSRSSVWGDTQPIKDTHTTMNNDRGHTRFTPELRTCDCCEARSEKKPVDGGGRKFSTEEPADAQDMTELGLRCTTELDSEGGVPGAEAALARFFRDEFRGGGVAWRWIAGSGSDTRTSGWGHQPPTEDTHNDELRSNTHTQHASRACDCDCEARSTDLCCRCLSRRALSPFGIQRYQRHN